MRVRVLRRRRQVRPGRAVAVQSRCRAGQAPEERSRPHSVDGPGPAIRRDRASRAHPARLAPDRCRATGAAASVGRLVDRAWSSRPRHVRDDRSSGARHRDPGLDHGPVASRRPRSIDRRSAQPAPRGGVTVVRRSAAGVDARPGGVVLDLRRARDHRHPGLASTAPSAAHRRAQDRHRRRQCDHRHDGSATSARARHRRGTRLGPDHGLDMGTRRARSDEPGPPHRASIRATPCLPGRRSRDQRLAAAPGPVDPCAIAVVRADRRRPPSARSLCAASGIASPRGRCGQDESTLRASGRPSVAWRRPLRSQDGS